MHINLNEALALLDRWKAQSTPLRVVLSLSKARQEFHGAIADLNGTVITVIGLDRKLDLRGAELNGDLGDKAYLVCEFPDGDRYSFRVASTP